MRPGLLRLTAILVVLACSLAAEARELTVRPPVAPPVVPDVSLPSLPSPNPFGTDGPPRPLTDVIVDGHTRFLVSGAAQARCPGDRVLFVPGVVNAYRPTQPGDGAFMCRADAITEGFIGP